MGQCTRKLTASSLLTLIILGIALLATSAPSTADNQIMIADFMNSNLVGWKSKVFKNTTEYTPVKEDGFPALHALSIASASGLYKDQTIDLTKTPYLNWRWKIKEPLKDLNERTKPGDDYVARVYVVIDGGWQIWKTKALNYVWSSNQRKGTLWDNAFAGSAAKMLAVRGKEDTPGKWYAEKRHVIDDLKMAFISSDSNKSEWDNNQIDIIAIMTDTDNSGLQAEAWYGAIYFSDK
ncbi:MAG: DUF3047 domain-containing protein [Pseudomonadales bacterium]|nr:DUF3047 domain-containing protein [Pseudomonadales bacterium]